MKIENKVENHFNEVINNYEEKLQAHTPDFKLSEFERLIMKNALIYGYEYVLEKYSLKININSKV